MQIILYALLLKTFHCLVVSLVTLTKFHHTDQEIAFICLEQRTVCRSFMPCEPIEPKHNKSLILVFLGNCTSVNLRYHGNDGALFS